MATDNYAIADQFSLLAKLMDIHGENSFKTKSYSIAAFTIEKLPEQLSSLSHEKIFSIKGIGENIGKKILGILATGELALLSEFIQKTPPGIIEMLNIKGIGPKKISTIWKEMELESIGELLYACNENRLLLYKGFGEKTQKNVKETIEFYIKNQGTYLYAQTEEYAKVINEELKKHFPSGAFEHSGDYKRQSEIIHQLEWITSVPLSDLKTFFQSNDHSIVHEDEQNFTCQGPEGIKLSFHYSSQGQFYRRLFERTSSEEFLTAWKKHFSWDDSTTYQSEEEIFLKAGIPYLHSRLREFGSSIDKSKAGSLPTVIQTNDIRAIIHSHSNWSDGSDTIDKMASACIEKGYEYLVISDHSKSAFYANGLNEERIQAQHQYIDELNTRFSPFKIFKSIECDILNDGSLDYAADILSTFDLVIASVHSNLKMSEEKAMARLLAAIANPYTTILGHMTGRLLLSRPGYPVDHKRIIDACSVNNVVIELNAHPRRLDMDWRWIEYAMEKEVLISIDPDAHSTSGFADVRYGVLAAQKGMLTKEKNLSSFNLAEFQHFLANRKQ